MTITVRPQELSLDALAGSLTTMFDIADPADPTPYVLSPSTGEVISQ